MRTAESEPPGTIGGIRGTSPGEAAARIRSEQGWQGLGPSVVVTDLGIHHFDEDGEMRLDALHPGATLDAVRASMAWEVRLADPLVRTPEPTDEELRIMREELDPEGRSTR